MKKALRHSATIFLLLLCFSQYADAIRSLPDASTRFQKSLSSYLQSKSAANAQAVVAEYDDAENTDKYRRTFDSTLSVNGLTISRLRAIPAPSKALATSEPTQPEESEDEKKQEDTEEKLDEESEDLEDLDKIPLFQPKVKVVKDDQTQIEAITDKQTDLGQQMVMLIDELDDLDRETAQLMRGPVIGVGMKKPLPSVDNVRKILANRLKADSILKNIVNVERQIAEKQAQKKVVQARMIENEKNLISDVEKRLQQKIDQFKSNQQASLKRIAALESQKPTKTNQNRLAQAKRALVRTQARMGRAQSKLDSYKYMLENFPDALSKKIELDRAATQEVSKDLTQLAEALTDLQTEKARINSAGSTSLQEALQAEKTPLTEKAMQAIENLQNRLNKRLPNALGTSLSNPAVPLQFPELQLPTNYKNSVLQNAQEAAKALQDRTGSMFKEAKTNINTKTAALANQLPKVVQQGRAQVSKNVATALNGFNRALQLLKGKL